MNMAALNTLFKDRPLQILMASLIAVFILTTITFVHTGNLRTENESLAAQLTRLHSEGGNIRRLKETVAAKEKKAAARSAGIVPTLETILKEMGIKASTIKPLGKKKADEFSEENAELEIENIDLNQLVNLLHIFDTSATLIKTKDVSIHTAFEDPDTFILKLTVARLNK